MGRSREEDLRSVWERALERASLGVWDWNLRARECHYSDTWFRMLGYEPGELPDAEDLWLQLVHPDDRDQAVASGDRHIQGDIPSIETELRLRHKDGHWIWVLDRGGIVEWDEFGQPLRLVGVQTDITKQKAAEEELERVNQRFRLALEASRTGIWHFDAASQKSFWDNRTREIFGLPPGEGEISSDTWHRFLHPDDKEEAERQHSRAIESNGQIKLRYRILRTDGEVRHVETLARYMPDPRPAGRLVGTIRDVTDEVSVADALKTEKERLRVTLQSISDAVVSTDVQGNITFANPAATALFGREENELVGIHLADAFRPIAGPEAPLGLGGSTSVLSLHDTGGNATFVRCTTNPILAADGGSVGYVYTLQDITEERRKQQELAHAARHDTLTGLLNRSAFDTHLRDRVSLAEQSPFAIFYIDLDYFKALNDYAGHAAGDEALKAVARAVVRCLPENATIARLGGDEFAAILPTDDYTYAASAAAAMLDAVQHAQLQQNCGPRQLGASIGIVLVQDKATTPADALAYADDACYAAKADGRNRYAFFSKDVKTLSSSLTAARIVADIADAMEENRLMLFGQEIQLLDAPGSSTGSIEVLTRLNDRNGRMILPGEFIPPAERFGRIAALDRWVIKSALRQFGHALRSTTGVRLGFNLSAQTLSDAHLWEFVDAAIAESGAPYEAIAFEITETTAVTRFDAAERFVRSARDRGCRVGLDDFGAGLSSFEYLRRFPIDSIKINGSFVQNLSDSRFDRQIVSAIASVAESLGYEVVAEKIQDQRTLSVLREMKVRFGQGYLLHRPEPLEDILRRLEESPQAARR
jgi:diguanylate cyclase (GGDEF)-like protein/PAS domain S-box-containing protein